MKDIDFKDKTRILKNELNTYGAKLKHGQALNVLAKIEGYKTYSDYKREEEKKNTQTIEINKEIWDNFISKRADFGVPAEILLEGLIEQELYQTNDEIKVYKYEDKNFDTYLVFAKSKHDALAIIDGSHLPPDTYDIERVKELSFEIFYGIMLKNTWQGLDNCDCMYHVYESELIDTNGGNEILFPETLIEYQNSLEAMELVDGQIVPDLHDEKISQWLKEEKEKNPEEYTRYMELHKIVLETDKIVKGE